MSYLTSFFSHASQVQRAASGCGIGVTVRLSDFCLVLNTASGEQVWLPKFIARHAERLIYTPQIVPNTMGFCGWTPYQLRSWPEGSSKAAFKEAAAALGIATPASAAHPALLAQPFIVKAETSSFGEGIRGPFLAFDASDPLQHPGAGEYCEAFIPGAILKAWCWGGQCVAVQRELPTRVVGDGRSSLEQLVLALPNQRPDHDWNTVAAVAGCCGIRSLEKVPAAGRKVVVEFRYGSRYAPQDFQDTDALADMRRAGTAAAIERAAGLLWHRISTMHATPVSLYTLDAMMDTEGRTWFLEMNCHPTVHPNAYRAMMEEGSRLQPARRPASPAGSTMVLRGPAGNDSVKPRGFPADELAETR